MHPCHGLLLMLMLSATWISNTAKMLKSWSAKKVASVRLQLAIAKEIVLRLDKAQDTRILMPHELALRRKSKLCSLGLASLQRMLVRQRSKITFLAEGDANSGDANSRFFHLEACHRSRKGHISKLKAYDTHDVRERAGHKGDAAQSHQP